MPQPDWYLSYLQHVLLEPACARSAVIITPPMAKAVTPAHWPTDARNARRETLVATLSAKLPTRSNMTHLLGRKRRWLARWFAFRRIVGFRYD